MKLRQFKGALIFLWATPLTLSLLRPLSLARCLPLCCNVMLAGMAAENKRVADTQTLTGFWSYTRADAQNSGGRLDALRHLVLNELGLAVGTRPAVELWHDTSSIPYGKDWELTISQAVDRATFFVPIVTPAFLQSQWCWRELRMFIGRQSISGRSDLIFPIFYIEVGRVDVNDPDQCQDRAAFELLRARQGMNFVALRNKDLQSHEVSAEIERLAWNIRDAALPALAAAANAAARAAREAVEAARANPIRNQAEEPVRTAATRSRTDKTTADRAGAASVVDQAIGPSTPVSGSEPTQTGLDLRQSVEIDLTEAFAGTKVNVRVPALRTCSDCNGSGRVGRDACSICSGTGVMQRERSLEVKLPAGIEDGTRIRLAGEGNSGAPGTPNGDLYVRVAIRPHPFFQRELANVLMRVPLRMTQAALGDTIEVPLVDGTRAAVKIPPGTQTGDQFRLRNKGFTVLRSPARGDMFIQVAVETPQSLSLRERELLEQLAVESRKNAGGSPDNTGFFAQVKKFFEG